MRSAKTVLTFLFCGLALGASFGWLLSVRRLTTFWFREGDKFLIPTYRYYFGVGVFLLLSLALAYSISVARGWISKPTPRTFLKHSLAAIIVATSALLVFAATRLPAGAFLYPIATYLTAIVTFVMLVSMACWVLTAKLYYPGLVINLLTIPAAIALLWFLAKTLTIPGEWSELVTYAIYDSLLSAACGFWIVQKMSRSSSLAV